jgi:hypothetical protein
MSRTPARKLTPVWGFVSLVVLSAVARLGLAWEWPFPQCWMRKLTGIPCPSCGCTRSLAAWSHLDFEQAFRFNPLFFFVCAGLAAWAALAVVERSFQTTLFPSL